MPASQLNLPLISVEQLWRLFPWHRQYPRKLSTFCSEPALMLQEAPSPTPQVQAHPEVWGNLCSQENLQQMGDWSKWIMLCPPSPHPPGTQSGECSVARSQPCNLQRCLENTHLYWLFLLPCLTLPTHFLSATSSGHRLPNQLPTPKSLSQALLSGESKLKTT